MSNITVVLGSQWGDEGKGKLVDILGENHSVIVRAGGGANAGHTIVRDGKKYVFHLLPSGLLTEGNIGVVGNGCVVDIHQLCLEIDNLEKNGLSLDGRIFVSDRAQILFPYHMEIDGLQEARRGEEGIGTTKRGIGPCYADKISRQGIRGRDLLDRNIFEKKLIAISSRLKSVYNIELNIADELKKYDEIIERVRPFIVDTSYLLEKLQNEGKNILIEGAQAFFLDIDFGTYPYVTSSSISTGGMATGCGIDPRSFSEVIGVLKAYTTRVGEGPFPSELFDENGKKLGEIGHEFGATTGRPRRCGWLDLFMMKSFVRVNGPDCWNITKLDILDSFSEISIVTGYELKGEQLETFPADSDDLENISPVLTTLKGWNEDISSIKNYDDLPENAKKYLTFIEEYTGVKVKYIGTGVGNDDLIVR